MEPILGQAVVIENKGGAGWRYWCGRNRQVGP